MKICVMNWMCIERADIFRLLRVLIVSTLYEETPNRKTGLKSRVKNIHSTHVTTYNYELQ
jgi:hypothetical protein